MLARQECLRFHIGLRRIRTISCAGDQWSPLQILSIPFRRIETERYPIVFRKQKASARIVCGHCPPSNARPYIFVENKTPGIVPEKENDTERRAVPADIFVTKISIIGRLLGTARFVSLPQERYRASPKDVTNTTALCTHCLPALPGYSVYSFAASAKGPGITSQPRKAPK